MAAVELDCTLASAVKRVCVCVCISVQFFERNATGAGSNMVSERHFVVVTSQGFFDAFYDHG